MGSRLGVPGHCCEGELHPVLSLSSWLTKIHHEMNHDFLLPLYPIHSEAFHTLGPVSEHLTFDDLEGVQRDILASLEFDIFDVTPQV